MDVRLLMALSLLTIAFAGCADDGTDDGEAMLESEEQAAGTGDADSIQVDATVTYSGFYGAPTGNTYTSTLTVQQGAMLTVTFENNDQNAAVMHDWYLEILDVGTDAIEAGETAEVTFFVDLEPGQYVYYCSIGNHRDNGMEGILTVTAA